MFWKLPVEVRDVIYILVYREARQLHIKRRSLWERSERVGRTLHIAAHTVRSQHR